MFSIELPAIPDHLKKQLFIVSNCKLVANRKAMEETKISASSQYKGKPLDSPLVVKFKFYIKSNERGFFQQELSHGKAQSVAPYCSNLIKFYEDALTGILWTIGSRITLLSACKIYDKRPRVEIEVAEIFNNEEIL